MKTNWNRKHAPELTTSAPHIRDYSTVGQLDSPKGAQSHQVSLSVMLRPTGGSTLEQFLCSSPCHTSSNLKWSRDMKEQNTPVLPVSLIQELQLSGFPVKNMLELVFVLDLSGTETRQSIGYLVCEVKTGNWTFWVTLTMLMGFRDRW